MSVRNIQIAAHVYFDKQDDHQLYVSTFQFPPKSLPYKADLRQKRHSDTVASGVKFLRFLGIK
jgi:hypothetical protein